MAAAATAEKPERVVYTAGGGRRTFFSFMFLLLLPFFISLPAMLYMRLTKGLWFDTAGLAIMATAFALLMFLIIIELVFSLRTSIELGDEAVKATLPAGRGPTPMLRYKSYTLPYKDIATVESRREVYGGALAPVLLKGSRIVMKDGTKVPLGYISEANVDPAFPYPEIAAKIAERAGIAHTDRGSVYRSVRNKMFGIKSALAETPPPPIDDAAIVELNRRHNNLILGLIGGLVVLIAIGLVSDFVEERDASPAPAAIPAKAPAKK